MVSLADLSVVVAETVHCNQNVGVGHWVQKEVVAVVPSHQLLLYPLHSRLVNPFGLCFIV